MAMKALRFTIGAVVIAATTATAACWYTGQRFEDGFSSAIGQYQHPDLAIQLVEYERGLFSATATTEWQLKAPNETLSFHLTHQIKHGPLPAGKLARLESTLVNEQLPEQLVTLFAGQPPLRIDSTVYLSGNHQHQLSSPTARQEIEGVEISWQGAQGALAFSEDNHRLDAQLDIPGLSLNDGHNRLQLEGMSLQADSHRPIGQRFWLGPIESSLQGLRFNDPNESFSLQGMKVSANSTQEGEQLTIQQHIALGSLTVDDHQLHDLRLGIELGRLDASSMSRILTILEQARSQQEMLALWEELPRLLAHQPYLALTELSGRHNDTGDAQVEARLDYLGNGNLMAFNPNSDILLDASFEAAAEVVKAIIAEQQRMELLRLAAMLEWDTRSEEFEILLEQSIRAQQNALLERGLVVADGDRWRSHARLEDGSMTLNGRPADALVGQLLQLLF